MTYARVLRFGLGFAALGLVGCGGTTTPTPTATSTPTPTPSPTPTPTPTPTFAYQTLDQLTGDQTFQSAGVTYVGVGTPTISTLAFGSGLVISYDAEADNITLTAPGGVPQVTFNEANATMPAANVLRWDLGGSGPPNIVTLIGTGTGYSFLGSWIIGDGPGQPRAYLVTGGVPTLAGDMPTSGTVIYTLGVGGALVRGGVTSSVDSAASSGTLTVTFSATGGTGTISIPLKETGTGVSLGTLTGTITITQGSNAFTGQVQVTGVTNSSTAIAGAFFGPQAQEMGGAFALEGADNGYVGQAFGSKQAATAP